MKGRRYLFMKSLQGSKKQRKMDDGDNFEVKNDIGSGSEQKSLNNVDGGSMELASDAETLTSSSKRKRLASSRTGRKADILLHSKGGMSVSDDHASDVNTRSESSDVSSAGEDMVDDIEVFRNKNENSLQDESKKLVSPAFSHVGRALAKRRKHQMDTSE